MAGWGDDPELEELRRLLYEEGWEPVEVTVGRGPEGLDVVIVCKGDEKRTVTSDHIAFHRFVEGLLEDRPDLRS